MKTNRKPTNGWCCNIPYCVMIWHGEWSDPEVNIGGHFILNYYDFEQYVFDSLNVNDWLYTDENFDTLLDNATHKQRLAIYKDILRNY